MASIDAFVSGVEEIHPETAQGIRLVGTYSVGFSKALDLKLKAGLFSWQTDYTLTGNSVSREVNVSDTDVTGGLTLDYELGKGIHGIDPDTGERYYVIGGKKAAELGVGAHGIDPDKFLEELNKAAKKKK